mgnify:CR=1 FL=1|jgi:hypothetical protein
MLLRLCRFGLAHEDFQPFRGGHLVDQLVMEPAQLRSAGAHLHGLVDAASLELTQVSLELVGALLGGVFRGFESSGVRLA